MRPKPRDSIEILILWEHKFSQQNEGIGFAKEWGLSSIVLEGEVRVVYEALEICEMDLSHNRTILSDVYTLAAGFHHIKPHFILREFNFVTDELASFSKTLITHILVGDIP